MMIYFIYVWSTSRIELIIFAKICAMCHALTANAFHQTSVDDATAAAADHDDDDDDEWSCCNRNTSCFLMDAISYQENRYITCDTRTLRLLPSTSFAFSHLSFYH